METLAVTATVPVSSHFDHKHESEHKDSIVNSNASLDLKLPFSSFTPFSTSSTNNSPKSSRTSNLSPPPPPGPFFSSRAEPNLQRFASRRLVGRSATKRSIRFSTTMELWGDESPRAGEVEEMKKRSNWRTQLARCYSICFHYCACISPIQLFHELYQYLLQFDFNYFLLTVLLLLISFFFRYFYPNVIGTWGNPIYTWFFGCVIVIVIYEVAAVVELIWLSFISLFVTTIFGEFTFLVMSRIHISMDRIRTSRRC